MAPIHNVEHTTTTTTTSDIIRAAAVMLGLAVAPLGAFAAAGLTAMMVLGLIVRFRIHDAPRLMVPAASLGALNAVLVVLFLSQ